MQHWHALGFGRVLLKLTHMYGRLQCCALRAVLVLANNRHSPNSPTRSRSTCPVNCACVSTRSLVRHTTPAHRCGAACQRTMHLTRTAARNTLTRVVSQESLATIFHIQRQGMENFLEEQGKGGSGEPPPRKKEFLTHRAQQLFLLSSLPCFLSGAAPQRGAVICF